MASLPRPGGNITGLSNMAEGVSTKWVELLKEVAPRATRLAVLWDPRNVAHASMWREIQGAGRALTVTPLAWEARGPDEIERAFAAMGSERIEREKVGASHAPFGRPRRAPSSPLRAASIDTTGRALISVCMVVFSLGHEEGEGCFRNRGDT